jgi:Rrf2 family protein
MLDLSNHHQRGLVHISDLAERKKIPKKFLGQILLELKKGGLVQSKKGPNGGYSLVQTPEKIMVGDVIRLMDNSLFSENSDGFNNTPGNDNNFKENFFGVFHEVETAVRRVIDNISFAEIQKREADIYSQEASGYVYFI